MYPEEVLSSSSTHFSHCPCVGRITSTHSCHYLLQRYAAKKPVEYLQLQAGMLDVCAVGVSICVQGWKKWLHRFKFVSSNLWIQRSQSYPYEDKHCCCHPGKAGKPLHHTTLMLKYSLSSFFFLKKNLDITQLYFLTTTLFPFTCWQNCRKTGRMKGIIFPII